VTKIIGHQMSDNAAARAPLPLRPPLVSQTAAAIRARIEAGRWQFGEQLPSEPQLASELGISRATLRESVRLLISNGLLDRRHGVGTFVARVPPPSIDRGIDELFGAGDAIAQLGYAPAVGDCRIELVPAPEVVAHELRLPKDAAVCHLERVRLADGRPVMLCDDYIDARLLLERDIALDDIQRQLFARAGSLYAWLEHDVGRAIDTALARIEPVVATKESAAALGVAEGSALLRLRQTHFGPDGSQVLYSENVHNSELMHFHVVRRRARSEF
jgi:GntR family transcriptional regulator